MGFPTEPWLKRHHLFREGFTLNKWNQLASYSAPPGALPMVAPLLPPEIEHGELPTKIIPLDPASPTSAPPVPMLEATSTAPPMTPTVPLVTPTTSELSITISDSEFRGLIHIFQTLTTTHVALF